MRTRMWTGIVMAMMLVVSGLSGVQAAEIKIGAIFAVTGPASFLGAPEQKTAQMLVDEINANGGINGDKLVLIVKDSQGNPEKAVSFAKQLIEEENPERPLSDKDLEKKLTDAGIAIARRTIAKYREELNLPSSIHRKRKK